MIQLLFVCFVLLMLLNVPISISLGLSALLALIYSGAMPLVIVPQKMFTSIDLFPLMAIPFFMVAGSLMERGGISRRLVDVAKVVVGFFPGGLALVTVLASMFFAALSGSGPATVAAIGAIMIPAMVREGYGHSFAAATQASAGYIGIIIPPSIPMITYGVVTSTSISRLFMAGFVPGILVGLVLMAVAYAIAMRRNYRGTRRSSLREFWRTVREAFFALLMPFIILGGIYSGLFTPTEAANVAVVYGLFVSFFVYKELTLKDIPVLLRSAAVSSAMVLFLIATATTFGLLLTREQVPAHLAQTFIDLTSNPFVFLMIINVMLIVVGMFMEANAAIIILAPIFLPVIVQLGIDPVHFGIIMVINLAIGMVTPPLGINLFVASGMTKLRLEDIVKENWWYLLSAILLLFVLTYFPKVTLFLPNLLMG
jgi:C4-dicarboxylate transporter DctM subunit